MSPTERSSPSPYESRFPRKPTSAPTGDTDRLADLIECTDNDWTTITPYPEDGSDPGPTLYDEFAAAIHTALADGTLTPEDIGMERWCNYDGDFGCYCDPTWRLPSKEVTDG